MKLKQMALLVLAAVLILLISGCKATQEDIPATTTEAAITTTEAATTQEATTLAAETQKEVTWQVLDLQDKANAKQKSFLEKAYAEELESREPDVDQPMGASKVVGVRGGGAELRQMFLRENGKETVLLEEKRNDEFADGSESPRFAQVLDDRFFIYRWIGWEWEAGSGVYDTVRMKAIPVETKKIESVAGADVTYAGAFGDVLYMEDGWYAQKVSPLRLFSVDLKGLDKAESLPVGKNILEDIPEAKEKDVSYTHCGFSPDGKYYFAAQDTPFDSEEFIVLIFDISAKKFVSRVHVPKNAASHGIATFREDSKTLYFYDSIQQVFSRYALEIKLP